MRDDCCTACGSEMMHLHPYQPDRPDEPGHGDYWECLACGHTKEYEKDYEYYEEDD